MAKKNTKTAKKTKADRFNVPYSEIQKKQEEQGTARTATEEPKPIRQGNSTFEVEYSESGGVKKEDVRTVSVAHARAIFQSSHPEATIVKITEKTG